MTAIYDVVIEVTRLETEDADRLHAHLMVKPALTAMANALRVGEHILTRMA